MGYQKMRIIFVKNTDLSEIQMGNVVIGESILKLNQKELADSGNVHYSYDYHGLSLGVDEEQNIVKILAASDGEISIHGKRIGKRMADITNELGNNYYDALYDYGQGLKKRVYMDRENGRKLDVVYISGNASEFLWLIIEKT